MTLRWTWGFVSHMQASFAVSAWGLYYPKSLQQDKMMAIFFQLVKKIPIDCFLSLVDFAYKISSTFGNCYHLPATKHEELQTKEYH